MDLKSFLSASSTRAVRHGKSRGRYPQRRILAMRRSRRLRSPSFANPYHSFIHSGHFYSAPSSPLLLRGAPDYSTDTVSEFHVEAHRQLQVKDLPKVPT